MAIIKSGASTDEWTIDPISKAGRVTLYSSGGLELLNRPTYSATTANFTPAATATDLFVISGSASKTVQILSVTLIGTATAATVIDSFILKRSSANSGGTSVASTVVQHNTSDPATTVATIQHYTANPSVLGTSDGVIKRNKVNLPIATTAVYPTPNELLPVCPVGVYSPITLNGTSQFLCVNNNAAAIPAGGANWSISITWTEF